jgi:hypothetical protein
LRLLYLGCQWKERPIEKDRQGRLGYSPSRATSVIRPRCGKWPINVEK